MADRDRLLAALRGTVSTILAEHSTVCVASTSSAEALQRAAAYGITALGGR